MAMSFDPFSELDRLTGTLFGTPQGPKSTSTATATSTC
jgi:hypothetical protein